uniref:carnosine N-methyltransferase n=1 Tax=Pseudo-nitzschia australis TaxID=44445 RepID=A0A6U9YJI3_9STRA|mmetsp:Transcript_9276/g.20125  ORF Transcript_9276/g.20125 Transcript_9276/m.20125 type:complete len:437 (-) Transcript_9276:244-1554(-)|eukprot:CAMPEP_0168168482 /NCGR_PEP_ID=MMETSP0139_2-20121125/3115_1 /TAXON_ID=44445 /ORGANISM="Pseudo-nitzschia australis, Strain 10249 10 AB" /LENGTH=436 /DNA_ID=CAMNT_0008085811 /DNA_START=150 /DNA_END=1463 /DNA_ORIENTATION=-
MDNDISDQKLTSSFTQSQQRSRSDDDGKDHANENDDDETSHVDSVCAAYRQYGTFSMSQWTQREFRLKTLPESQKKLLPSGLRIGTPEYIKRFEDYKNATNQNQSCLDCILEHAVKNSQQQRSLKAVPANSYVTSDQISKVSSVLKSLARDWSAEGKIERATAYSPIKTLIQKYLPLDPRTSGTQLLPRILVPGSGVGRLAFDLAAMGYSVQCNEFSMYMLLALDFILNNGGSVCNPERPLHLSPWLQESRNVHAPTDPLRTIQIPDVDIMTILMPPVEDEEAMESRPVPEFSMVAGDFVSIYNQDQEAGQWDCVSSCFFLDATPNMVETLQVIYKMLKPGGLLVNLGPLLYHWSGPPMSPSDKSLQEYRQRYSHLDGRYFTGIDLCYDDVKVILNSIGFEILEEETGIECYYTTDQLSMMKTKYQCVSFVAKKTS